MLDRPDELLDQGPPGSGERRGTTGINTGISAARLYWENKADYFNAKNISIPFAISVFPDELYQVPRSWAERAYPRNLIHYHRLDRGGHFAAWEQPDLFAAEMRAAFRSLR